MKLLNTARNNGYGEYHRLDTNIFFPMPSHVLLVDFVVLPPGHSRNGTSEVGTPMRRSYVVPMVCEW